MIVGSCLRELEGWCGKNERILAGSRIPSSTSIEIGLELDSQDPREGCSKGKRNTAGFYDDLSSPPALLVACDNNTHTRLPPFLVPQHMHTFALAYILQPHIGHAACRSHTGIKLADALTEP